MLVLDEADRLLELGFQDELKEIVKECPTNRQTMLFSATLTEQVCPPFLSILPLFSSLFLLLFLFFLPLSSSSFLPTLS